MKLTTGAEWELVDLVCGAMVCDVGQLAISGKIGSKPGGNWRPSPPLSASFSSSLLLYKILGNM